MEQNALSRIRQIETEIIHLTETDREEAYQEARHRLAGPPIEERVYPPLQMPEQEPAEYPDWMIILVVSLCVLVLLAAFIPSAYRMYVAGSTVFCTAFSEMVEPVTEPDVENPAIPSTNPLAWDNISGVVCASVGVTTVLMAEIGQTVALLAIAVLGTTASTRDEIIKATKISNQIFWAVVGMTTIIAYAGNLHVAQPWSHQGPFFGFNLFAWILDLFPPTLVIGIMYAMKELMLYFIRRRFQYLMQIEKAKEERRQYMDDDRAEREAILDEPEEHPQWLRLYSLSLKERLMKVNDKQEGERRNSQSFVGRQHLMRSLQPAEWKHLIKMQMIASDFTVDPNQITAVEKLQSRLNQQAEESGYAEPGITEEKIADIITKTDGPIQQTDDGKWQYTSPKYGAVRGGFASAKDAEKAMKAYEYHKGRREEGKA